MIFMVIFHISIMDSLWRNPIQLGLDLNAENIDDNLVTWSTFTAMFDLHQKKLVPWPLSVMAADIPAECVKPANIPKMRSPEFSVILDKLWKVWEDNYFFSSEEFRGLFIHYFKVNYLVIMEYGIYHDCHLPLAA